MLIMQSFVATTISLFLLILPTQQPQSKVEPANAWMRVPSQAFRQSDTTTSENRTYVISILMA